MKKSEKLVLMSLFISISLMLHIFEGMLPIQLGTPGAKLGLANIVTVIALYLLSRKETFTILTVRIMLGSIFAGGVSGFLYSISGGILSFLMMVLLMSLFKEKISVVGVSIVGAVSHSMGQILMASFIIQNAGIFSYLPFLIMVSVGTGIFVGYLSKLMLELLPKHLKVLRGS